MTAVEAVDKLGSIVEEGGGGVVCRARSVDNISIDPTRVWLLLLLLCAFDACRSMGELGIEDEDAKATESCVASGSICDLARVLLLLAPLLPSSCCEVL